VNTLLDPAPHDPAAHRVGSVDPDELRTGMSRPQPGCVLLAVAGEIDTLTAPALERGLEQLLDEPGQVVVDLTGVTFLASSGLAVLIRAARRAGEQRRRLGLVAGSRAVTRPLEVTGCAQLFDMHATARDALAGGD
jgi:anti-sigma B factor antagonist